LRSTSFVTGIEITSETDFDVSVQEFSQSSLSLVVTNIGSSFASSVIVKILPLKDLIFVPETSVIGNLNPGDYATASFSVQNLNVSKENLNITRNLRVEISYTDSSGIRRKVEKEIPLTFLSSGLSSRTSISERYLPQSNLGIIYILVGVIGMIALVVIFKKLIRRKRK